MLLNLALLLVGLYLVIGVVFAVAFAWRGASAIDVAAAGSTWGFRIIIMPGAAALWPWLLRRWISS